jgi:hypothetical protein
MAQHSISFFQLEIATGSHQRITLTKVGYEAARVEDISRRQIRPSNILSIRDNAVAGGVALLTAGAKSPSVLQIPLRRIKKEAISSFGLRSRGVYNME